MSAGFAKRAAVREVKLNRQKLVPGEMIASVQAMRDGERFEVGDCRIAGQFEDEIRDESVDGEDGFVLWHVGLENEVFLS